MLSDAELLADYAASGSDEAFAEIVRRYMNPMYRVCLRILGDPAAAEDACQATFIVLMRKARRLPRNVVLAGWLLQTARFAARDACKLRQRRGKHEHAARVDDGRSQVEVDLLRDEISRYLDTALNSLPAPQRDSIILRYLCDRTEEDIARELHCPRTTVATRVASGLAKLRTKLATAGVTVPTVVLSAYLKDQALTIAPAKLTALIHGCCLGKQAASAAVVTIAEGTTRTLLWAQAKTAVTVSVVVLAASGTGLVAWNTLTPKPSLANLPRVNVAQVKRTPRIEPAVELPVPLVPDPVPPPPAEEEQPVDLTKLPPNTWVRLRRWTIQPEAADETGLWEPAGWNKMVYDPNAKRALFYDRWTDKKHGGYSSYANCTLALAPPSGQVTPVKIDHWTKRDDGKGGGLTIALAENAGEPTPCSRHVYSAFALAPELNALFICNGANLSAMQGDKHLGHALCADTWRLDLLSRTWTPVQSKAHPPNFPLAAAMDYCPDTKSMVYCNADQLWLLDVGSGQWRLSKNKAPAVGPGKAVLYDPPRRRMLIAGGAHKDASAVRTPANDKLFAFDPISESFSALADAPAPMFCAQLAYDSKRDLFFGAYVSPSGDSAIFCYDPARNAWSTMPTQNTTLSMARRQGWARLCYVTDFECLLALGRNAEHKPEFFAIRLLP